MGSRLTTGRLIAVAAAVQLGLAFGNWLIYAAVTPPSQFGWTVSLMLPFVLLVFAVLLPVSLIGAWLLDGMAARSRLGTAIGTLIAAAACGLLGIAATDGSVATGSMLVSRV